MPADNANLNKVMEKISPYCVVFRPLLLYQSAVFQIFYDFLSKTTSTNFINDVFAITKTKKHSFFCIIFSV